MMNMKRMLSLILAFVMVLGMIPVPAFATEGEEISSVDVVLSLSADDCFMVGPGSGAIMAMKDITVPYFDLALYGLEEYYFVSEVYGDDGDGKPGSDLVPGTAEYAYGKVTLLHLYIYALEVFYCGIDPEEAGKGYLYEEGLIGTEVFTISGGVGSSFLNQFWGGDCNLNYYVNYEYPLASEGWGATSDQILLRDGDIITLGHFTGWSFYADTYSIFNYITADAQAVTCGEDVTLTLYYAGPNLGTSTDTAQNLNPYCLDVYYAPYEDIPSEYVTDWEYVGTADENGELVVNTAALEAGEYIFAVAGQPGVDFPDDICSTPGGVRVNVLPVEEPANDQLISVTAGGNKAELTEFYTPYYQQIGYQIALDELCDVTVTGKDPLSNYIVDNAAYSWIQKELNDNTFVFTAEELKDLVVAKTEFEATGDWQYADAEWLTNSKDVVAVSFNDTSFMGYTILLIELPDGEPEDTALLVNEENMIHAFSDAAGYEGYLANVPEGIKTVKISLDGMNPDWAWLFGWGDSQEELYGMLVDENGWFDEFPEGMSYDAEENVVVIDLETYAQFPESGSRFYGDVDHWGAVKGTGTQYLVEVQNEDYTQITVMINVGGSTHFHDYNQQNVADEYLKSSATCTNAAVYYYSCKCGIKSTETFTYGEALGHDFVDGVCTRCGEVAEAFAYEINDTPSNGNNWAKLGNGTISGEVGGVLAHYWGSGSLTVLLTESTPDDALITSSFAVSGMKPTLSGTGNVTLVDGTGRQTIKLSSPFGTVATWNVLYTKDKAPVLAEGQNPEATGETAVNEGFAVSLEGVFADPDGDALTYQVSVDGGTYEAFEGSTYTYVPTVPGEHTLVFRADDGLLVSQDTYTVTVTAKNSSVTYDVPVTAPEGTVFYAVGEVVDGQAVKGDELVHADGVVKVPENITRIMWEADGLVGMSAPVSSGAALELVKVSFEAILDSGEIDEQAAIVVSDSEGVTVSGTAADTYLLPALAGFTYRATASGSNAGKYNPGQLTGQTPGTGKVTIPLILKHFTVIAPKGSIVSAGTLSGSFSYSFAEAIKVENVDDTVVYQFAPLSGSAFIRVQHPDDDAVTYWDFKSSKADGKTITVTEAMLFMNDAGSDGEFNSDTVYRNFEYYSFDLGDIYMNINNQGYIDLDIGEVKALNMFRNWQAINSFTNDKIAIPDFEYEIVNIEGDNVVSIVPDANNTGAATMTATGEGTAIVLVTYDAMYSELTATGSLGGEGGGNRLSAIWPDRTGVFVVSVGKDGTGIQSNMTCNGAIFDAEHSPQFYHGDEGASVSFIPEEGVTVTVNRSTVGEKKLSFGEFTSEGVSVNAETGEVTVSGLTTGRHIIRLEKDGVAAYQVVTATQTTVTMTDSEGNALSLEEKLQPGQTVKLTVTGLTSPAEKFATKYNFNCQITYKDQFGNAYSNSSGATYGKYDFSSIPQVVTVTIPEDWTESTLTLNGFMKMGGFAGDGIGSHRKVSYGDNRGMANGSDAGMELGTLPEIVLNIMLGHEHSYEAVVTAPTCTEAGYTTYTCECGDSYTADETPALGHTEESIPGKDATCTETGLTEGKKCSVCGETLVAQEVVAALGHTEEVIPAVAPTCTETGLTEGKKCSVCGEITVQQQVVDALGHDFSEGTCTRCGEADPDYVTVIATGWSGYTTWVLTSNGTLTFSPTEQQENGQTNLKNYWKVNGVLTLPWGDYAESITKVVIEEGIHDIGQMAFYELPNLREVVLPESIVEIRNYAFKNCKSLTTINLDGVDFIREGAFYGCSALENVTFAKNVVIEDWAFSRTDITLP